MLGPAGKTVGTLLFWMSRYYPSVAFCSVLGLLAESGCRAQWTLCCDNPWVAKI